VDTGAYENLSGGDSIRRQAAAAKAAGFMTQWTVRDRPKQVSGVGDSAKQCVHDALVPAALSNGTFIRYNCPVISGDPSPTPTLYGLKDMSANNTYFGTRFGRMIQIPEGTDDQIIWPKGTKIIQCERAPSMHWLLTTNNWSLYKQAQQS
jgi:hypothetical protein